MMKIKTSLLSALLLATLCGSLQAQHHVTGCEEVTGLQAFRDSLLEVSAGGSFVNTGTVEYSLVRSLVNDGGFSDQSEGASCTADYADPCGTADKSALPAPVGGLNVFDELLDSTSLRGGQPVRMHDVQLNRKMGLANEWQLSGTLSWSGGLVTTDRSDLSHFLHFLHGSAVTGDSATRHVDGYAAWSGTGDFTLPTGDGGKLGKVGLAGSCGSTFKAAYFKGDPGSAALPTGAPFSTGERGEGLCAVSDVEYWDVDGADSTAVTLHFDAASDLDSIATDTSELVVAGWDGMKWVNLGKSAVSGSLAGGGSVTSGPVVPDQYTAFTFGVYDKTAPSATCQDVTVYLDATGNGSTAATAVDDGSTDACGIASLVLSDSTFNCDDLSASNITTGTTVTLTVTDDNDNTATCTASVTVLDTINPSATCQDVTVYLDATGNGSTTATAVDDGSTDACGIASLVLSDSTFNCNDLGAPGLAPGTTVTLTVTDDNGTTATCTASVTVLDTVPPSAQCKNVTRILSAQGNRVVTAAEVSDNSTVACGSADIALSQTSFNCTHLGPNTVTLTVSSDNGNSSTCTATVTILDGTPPKAFCQNASVVLDAQGSASLAASAVNNNSTDACGISSMALSQSEFTCAHVGANTVTLTVTDPGGNTNTCSAAVTVTDETAPVAKCKPATVQLGANGTITALASSVDDNSTDACGIATQVLSQTGFTCAELGPNPVTLTVTDPSGSSSSCTSTITVVDLLQPDAKCKNATAYLDTSGQVQVSPSLVNNASSDNCGIATTSLSKTTFDCSNIGANVVTLTATDASGNSKTCSATVVVADNLPPSLLCQDITVQVDGQGQASIAPAQVFNAAESGDNCSGPLTLAGVSPSVFYCSSLGANTVTLTASDARGNAATCQATVTVLGLFATVSTTVAPELCGGNPGSIAVNLPEVSGQVAYSINGGASWQFSNVFDNLSAGSYTLSVNIFGGYGCGALPTVVAVPVIGEVTNTWTGNGNSTSWLVNPKWSLGFKPLPCHDVVIPAGFEVELPSGGEGFGRTLTVEEGSMLTVEEGSTLTIVNY